MCLSDALQPCDNEPTSDMPTLLPLSSSEDTAVMKIAICLDLYRHRRRYRL